MEEPKDSVAFGPSWTQLFRLLATEASQASDVGSIPTAPTIHLHDGWTLTKNARGQKGANSSDDPVRARILPAARVTTGHAHFRMR